MLAVGPPTSVMVAAETIHPSKLPVTYNSRRTLSADRD